MEVQFDILKLSFLQKKTNIFNTCQIHYLKTEIKVKKSLFFHLFGNKLTAITTALCHISVTVAGHDRYLQTRIPARATNV